MTTIELKGIKIYAFHGCYKEEQQIGQYYLVDITIDLHTEEAQDDLSQTIDYSNILNIVEAEMAIKSKLIEHVAYRIKNALKQSFSKINELSVSVSKPSPPVRGEIQLVKVTV